MSLHSANWPPKKKVAIPGVSRDCFPIELTRKRQAVLARACEEAGVDVYAPPTILEGEKDIQQILGEMREAGCDAAAIYLGNFGPEGPTGLLAKKFGGPVMLCGAAEEGDLVDGRGDAFCGMMNTRLAMELHNVHFHLPKVPVALPNLLAQSIGHFAKVAELVNAVKSLKVIGFGPRPQDFYACNAPIQLLYDLGVGVEENSELDLLNLFQMVDAEDPDVLRTVIEMADELQVTDFDRELFVKMARFEVALMRYWETARGAYSYAVFANKCWPAFEKFFGFVPCFTNSRMAARGIPVACEVDIYGAVSQYLVQLASGKAATLLDINNTVPSNISSGHTLPSGVSPEDLFCGFHCGNTPSGCMKNCGLKYQLIMHRLMEAGQAPNITRGTLEGQIAPGSTTIFRLQGNLSGRLMAYVAEGAFLDIDPQSFGGIGVVGIPGFQRFYRNVLLEWGFPHHGAFGFGLCGSVIHDALRLLGVNAIGTPNKPGELYYAENPF